MWIGIFKIVSAAQRAASASVMRNVPAAALRDDLEDGAVVAVDGNALS
jgi:hypothetical protein